MTPEGRNIGYMDGTSSWRDAEHWGELLAITPENDELLAMNGIDPILARPIIPAIIEGLSIGTITSHQQALEHLAESMDQAWDESIIRDLHAACSDPDDPTIHFVGRLIRLKSDHGFKQRLTDRGADSAAMVADIKRSIEEAVLGSKSILDVVFRYERDYEILDYQELSTSEEFAKSVGAKGINPEAAQMIARSAAEKLIDGYSVKNVREWYNDELDRITPIN